MCAAKQTFSYRPHCGHWPKGGFAPFSRHSRVRRVTPEANFTVPRNQAVPLRPVIRAGLLPSKVTPHILRHTAITALVTAGVDLPTIQRISGHKTLAMILRYTQLSNAHVDRSMENLDAAFSATVTPELHTAPIGLAG